ncbi:hypothetical protein BLNAU_10629 [Blattamonas nauphoetae]|uniref:MSP domain-containing protein n=1 Tax=Blattamonas nauphoetae TaxID=2049346 RepID=A0ABQ9XT06_9EUKA|nr:hypothetical protein BLNAU_10629 [Blattamonas nauphoetae]
MSGETQNGRIVFTPSVLYFHFDVLLQSVPHKFAVRNFTDNTVEVDIFPPLHPSFDHVTKFTQVSIRSHSYQSLCLLYTANSFDRIDETFRFKALGQELLLPIVCLPYYKNLLLPPMISFEDCEQGQKITKTFDFDGMELHSYTFTAEPIDLHPSIKFSPATATIPKNGKVTFTITFDATHLPPNGSLGKILMRGVGLRERTTLIRFNTTVVDDAKADKHSVIPFNLHKLRSSVSNSTSRSSNATSMTTASSFQHASSLSSFTFSVSMSEETMNYITEITRSSESGRSRHRSEASSKRHKHKHRHSSKPSASSFTSDAFSSLFSSLPSTTLTKSITTPETQESESRLLQLISQTTNLSSSKTISTDVSLPPIDPRKPFVNHYIDNRELLLPSHRKHQLAQPSGEKLSPMVFEPLPLFHSKQEPTSPTSTSTSSFISSLSAAVTMRQKSRSRSSKHSSSSSSLTNPSLLVPSASPQAFPSTGPLFATPTIVPTAVPLDSTSDTLSTDQPSFTVTLSNTSDSSFIPDIPLDDILPSQDFHAWAYRPRFSKNLEPDTTVYAPTNILIALDPTPDSLRILSLAKKRFSAYGKHRETEIEMQQRRYRRFQFTDERVAYRVVSGEEKRWFGTRKLMMVVLAGKDIHSKQARTRKKFGL